MGNKEPRTFEEQLEILKSRGIRMDTEAEQSKALDIIKRVGYYKLINGYKKLFIDVFQDDANGIEEKYKEGVTVSEIYSLYYFDRDLREVLLRHILPVETHVKSLIAYTISIKYGNDNYLKYNNFNTDLKKAESIIPNVFSEIHRQISYRDSDPCINHYLSQYGFIPMWVLNNILTLGTISKLYSIMKPADRQMVSRVFSIQDVTMENFLLYLTDIRNISAHGNRLYCSRRKRPLINTPIHNSLGLPSGAGEYLNGKRDLFAALIALKYLVSNNDFDNMIREIDQLLKKLRPRLRTITIDDVLKEMGFPKNWKDIRKRDLKK